MKYLTPEQILFIHARLIKETGGSHGLRDLALLESAATRPKATFDGEDLYPDLFSKAAVLMESLIHDHAFVDGNKRVGITAVGLFLLGNSYRLAASNPELEAFTRQGAETKPDFAHIADWLVTHSVPLE